MGRNKNATRRPSDGARAKSSKPQGEQQLSNAVWAKIVKAIRELKEATSPDSKAAA